MLETLLIENSLSFRQFIQPLGGLWLLKNSTCILNQNLLLPLTGSNYIPRRMYWINGILLSCDSPSIIWKPTKFTLTFQFSRPRIPSKLSDDDMHFHSGHFLRVFGFVDTFIKVGTWKWKRWHSLLHTRATPFPLEFSVLCFISSWWSVFLHFTRHLIWLL